MRIALAVLAAAGSFCASAAPLAADDCCTQGQAKPWKDYNAGVRWEAALSPNPARFSARAAAQAIAAAPQADLAERERLVSAQAGISPKDSWKTAIEPALARARREGKLILFFQLVGDLDLEGC
jgi:hypothetical protein